MQPFLSPLCPFGALANCRGVALLLLTGLAFGLVGHLPAQALWPFGKAEKEKIILPGDEIPGQYPPPPVTQMQDECEPIRQQVVETNQGLFHRVTTKPIRARLKNKYRKCQDRYRQQEYDYLKHATIDAPPPKPVPALSPMPLPEVSSEASLQPSAPQLAQPPAFGPVLVPQPSVGPATTQDFITMFARPQPNTEQDAEPSEPGESEDEQSALQQPDQPAALKPAMAPLTQEVFSDQPFGDSMGASVTEATPPKDDVAGDDLMPPSMDDVPVEGMGGE